MRTLAGSMAGTWDMISEGPLVLMLWASPPDADRLVQPCTLSEWWSLCPDRDLFLLSLSCGVEWQPL